MIARGLRDAGMEVIYTGIFQTPDSIVRRRPRRRTPRSSGSRAFPEPTWSTPTDDPRALRQHGLDDVLVLVGGTIPAADAVELRRLGVAEIFTPGTPTARVIAFIESHAPRRDLGRGDAVGRCPVVGWRPPAVPSAHGLARRERLVRGSRRRHSRRTRRRGELSVRRRASCSGTSRGRAGTRSSLKRSTSRTASDRRSTACSSRRPPVGCWSRPASGSGWTTTIGPAGRGGRPILPALRIAGFDPATVDAVALSHLHFDHAGGLLDCRRRARVRPGPGGRAGAEWESRWHEPPAPASYDQAELRLVEPLGAEATARWRGGGVARRLGDRHRRPFGGHQAIIVRDAGTVGFIGDLFMRPWAPSRPGSPASTTSR